MRRLAFLTICRDICMHSFTKNTQKKMHTCRDMAGGLDGTCAVSLVARAGARGAGVHEGARASACVFLIRDKYLR